LGTPIKEEDKMRKIMLMFLAIFIVFIAGCQGGTPTPGGGTGPYVGGNDGLTFSFEEGMPPAEFGENDNVDVSVSVFNMGEYEIPENTIKIKLFGVAPLEFSTLDFEFKSVPNSLFPIEKGIFDVGGEAMVNMGSIDYAGSVNQQYYDRTLSAKVCYPYQTKSNVEACVTSKRIEDSDSESVCNYNSVKLASGSVSSGPIQITSFNEELRGLSQISFKIGFENEGTGNMYNKDSSCEDIDSLSAQQEKNKVYIKINNVDPESISCNFPTGGGVTGYLTLSEGQEKVLVCIMDVDQTTAYTQGLDITVDYKYTETTKREIRILSNQ
jgi:hypothetical protein